MPKNAVVQPVTQLAADLDEASADGAKIIVDRLTGASWLSGRITQAGGEPVLDSDPCALPKAIKNSVEIEGMRNCHVRDGAALTSFLAWLDRSTRPGSNVEVDELTAENTLAGYRGTVDGYRGFSFETISGFGPNGSPGALPVQ